MRTKSEPQIHRCMGSAKAIPGLVNFVVAVAYYFCLALPAAFTQPGDRLLAKPCRRRISAVRRLARNHEADRLNAGEKRRGRRGG